MYTSASGMSACLTCPAGFYCLPVTIANATLNSQSCPAGYYCPAGEWGDRFGLFSGKTSLNAC
ncbi:hypothetical protein DPMN_185094 [Dreissena polymorpha]|uniref:Uncharacterized protein n=1 Tax=Dreissena polymorpha TaxID=45954 RepID=A0A9D4I8F5_DREPO|nr:hypothetical protein DPMN_185094 [Dreissena polymorpha]